MTSGLIGLTLLAAGLTAPAFDLVTADGVSIRAQVRASVYSYEVSNVGAPPIRAFEVGYSDGYDFKAPEGWEIQNTPGTFRAVAGKDGLPIGPGRSELFSFRVTSRGGVLGTVTARCATDERAAVVVPRIWGVVPLPHSYLLVVAATLVGLALLHHVLTAARGRTPAAPQ
ncbi:MAG: hypothetical protein KA383_20530 [Phycisphaerae bacterium]|nr:hypothetical protein [Phycisphaerae bacterium]